MGGLLGGQRVCWPPLSNYWGGLAPPGPPPPLFLRLCDKQVNCNFRLDSPIAVNDPDLVVKSTGTIYWFRRLKLRTYCKTNSSNTEDPIECAISLGSRLYDTNEQDFNRNEETNSFDVSSAFSDQKWEVAQHGIGKSTRVVEMPVLKKSEPSNVTESFNYTELHFWMVLERTEYFNQQRDKALELKSLSSGAVYYSTSVFILLSLVLLFYLR